MSGIPVFLQRYGDRRTPLDGVRRIRTLCESHGSFIVIVEGTGLGEHGFARYTAASELEARFLVNRVTTAAITNEHYFLSGISDDVLRDESTDAEAVFRRKGHPTL